MADMETYVFCTNCGWEWKILELGVYYDNENNAIRCYCPNCNWNEFTEDNKEEDEELVRVMEEADYEDYSLEGITIYKEVM